LLSTLNVVKSIIAAAAQPPMSKAADVFGRFELVTFSAFFYVLGTIIEASSTNIQTYAGGQVKRHTHVENQNCSILISFSI
jgi:SIT family siderophore-iron:H+ symporter-like MFS transporter